MCHQSVGLIARAVEAAGISTVSLSSARSITAAVNPPRAVFLDYPLGQTAGRQGSKDEQDKVLGAALAALQSMTDAGAIRDIDLVWAANDDWKDNVMRVDTNQSNPANDDRSPRLPTPQYASLDDANAADPNCPSCVFFETN